MGDKLVTLQQELPGTEDRPPQEMGLEEAFDAEEARVDAVLKAAKKYTQTLKGWKKACQGGNGVNRQKYAAQAQELAAPLAGITDEAASVWTFDVGAYIESGRWMEDLEQAAALVGLRMMRDEDSFISPPVVVRARGRSALTIGRTQCGNLRASVVAATLRRLRDQKSSSNAVEFLECLFAVWQKLRSDDQPVARFRDIYDHFCLTPGWKKDNSAMVFAQAIYALHRSDVRVTRKGHSFQFEFASGKVKKKDIFTVYSEDGTPRRYYGIRFREVGK